MDLTTAQLMYHTKRPLLKSELTIIKNYNFSNTAINLVLKEMERTGIFLYKTDNPIKPYLLWDNKFIEVEISNGYILENLLQFKNSKQNVVQELIESKDYVGLFTVVDDSMRPLIFEENKDLLPNDQLREILLYIYTSGDHVLQALQSETIINILSQKKSSAISKLEEQYGKKLTIYRGAGDRSTRLENALSWSLDEEVAEFYANRWSDKGVVYQGEVSTDAILEYIPHENEILVQPNQVKVF
ncbi:hypothetical protein K5E_21520 [Enterococcus thailandicus]|uniref:hypothetical protein n=1 Tax=Enterococcus thailandicus TaxID=417368 RepID=UPI00244D7EF4|nr:hypothetical protein [Enterococcus thailandicus]GMC10013.1 hypothetical protein K5E_21520 [Enterococcus thailandicus]